jgi:beta-glucanase (GH16 family)
MLAVVVLSGALLCGCGGSGGTSPVPSGPPQSPAATAPTITTAAAQNGAVIVTLASATSGATVYYTLDGSAPTTSSQVYQAPFLVASNITVEALATAPSNSASSVTSRSFTPNISSGTLVWSDEFTNTVGGKGQPDPKVWTYDAGNSGFGNNELENYCAWGSNTAPCSTTSPNAYVGTDNALHIVAQQPSSGVFTSARLKSQGLFSLQYGRVEARIQLPESQGMWPAFWLLGNNITTVNWPACGELDVMEHINGSNPTNDGYDWVEGSVHGTGMDGGIKFHPTGFSAAAWHTYGMIWSKGQVTYYVDDPANIYASYSSSTMSGTWPFDVGPQFLLLNLAVGGNWPGSPNTTTVFPSEMVVDYVRIYTN